MNDSERPNRARTLAIAYAQLFRLPNLFTAFADVLLGFFISHNIGGPYPTPWLALVMLLGTSGFLYTAGMVLNDVFDAEVDARERPDRPIPSGRVPWEVAQLIGFEFLIVGTALGWGVSWLDGGLRAGLLATMLAVAILLYDKILKRTPVAPLVMGSCRFLNVLLGMSTLAGPLEAWHYLIAAGIGVYIAGVTWFARTEARVSNRFLLGWGVLVMAQGIALLAWFPSWLTDVSLRATPEEIASEIVRWQWMMSLLGALIIWRPLWAVIDPTPRRVQFAVKHCLLSLIVLDATVCLVVGGRIEGLVILLLLVPAVGLGYLLSSKAIT